MFKESTPGSSLRAKIHVQSQAAQAGNRNINGQFNVT